MPWYTRLKLRLLLFSATVLLCLFRLDRFLILRIFEPASRFIQLLTGYNCFIQKRVCFLCAAACAIWSTIRMTGLLNGPARKFLVPFFAFTNLCIFGLWFYRSVFGLGNDHLIESATILGGQNPNKFLLTSVGTRLVFLCFFVFILPLPPHAVPGDFLNLSLLIAFYLDACDPLPPAPVWRHAPDSV